MNTKTRIHIRRGDLERTSNHWSGVAIVDRLNPQHMTGDRSVCFVVGPGEHRIGVSLPRSRLFSLTDGVTSVCIRTEAEETIEMICGLKPAWRRFLRNCKLGQAGVLLSGGVAAYLGWAFYVQLREAVAFVVMMLGPHVSRVSLLYLLVSGKVITMSCVSLVWMIPASQVIFYHQRQRCKKLLARLGSPCFLDVRFEEELVSVHFSGKN